VHGGNILGTADGGVSLIDFGSARRLDDDDPQPRAGVLTEYEPEAARELIAERQPPPATPLGEQYCVAAMAFRLVTLMPCLRLSLEGATALRQIVDQPARPLADAGISWPSLEGVLHRALSKMPEDRFASLAELVAALRRALADRPVEIEARAGAVSVRRDRALDALLRVYGPDGTLIDTGLAQGPTCSLYYGATGVAYALLRAAMLESSATALDGAEAWIEQAIAHSTDRLAYENPEVGIFANEIAPTSVAHTAAGTHAVRAMVRYVSGDAPGAARSTQAFLDVIASVDPSADRRFLVDLMNGPAGHLQAAALLYDLCRSLDASLRRRLSMVIDTMSVEVTRNLTRARVESTADDPRYVGMAHGAAGSLFALSQASAAPGRALSAAADGLEWLAGQARDVAGGVAWPVNAGSQPGSPWTGWCHGSAGHIILWSLVTRLRGRDHDRDRALGAANHLWSNRQHGNPTICCGLAGEALSLCAAARMSGDAIWIERARALFAQASTAFDPIAPHSLFRGHLGIALTALELEHPERAAFPLSEPLM
jgi:serine/threonine-protein kinase